MRTARLIAKALLFLFVGLCAVLALAHLGLRHIDAVQAFSAWLDVAKPVFVASYILAIAALWWRWSQTIHWLASKSLVHPSNVAMALSQRNRIITMLVALEVIVVMGLPFNLFR